MKLARRQNRVNRLNRFLVGCDCNRPTLDSIQDAGFVPDQIEHREFPAAPTFVRPLIIGSATAPKQADMDKAKRSATAIS